MPDYRCDYLGVHLPVYQRIARSERAGWSTSEEAECTFRQVASALAAPGVPQEGRLLELGCGDCCLSVLLAQRLGYAVAGVDIVPLALDLGARRAAVAGACIQLRLGDVRALPWPDASFDVLVDGHCLHCIVLDDRRRFFSEARRVLRPGGVLVIVTMVGDPPPGAEFEFDRELRVQVRDGVAGRHFGTVESILAELSVGGLELVSHKIWPADSPEMCDDLVAVALRPSS